MDRAFRSKDMSCFTDRGHPHVNISKACIDIFDHRIRGNPGGKYLPLFTDIEMNNCSNVYQIREITESDFSMERLKISFQTISLRLTGASKVRLTESRDSRESRLFLFSFPALESSFFCAALSSVNHSISFDFVDLCFLFIYEMEVK